MSRNLYFYLASQISFHFPNKIIMKKIRKIRIYNLLTCLNIHLIREILSYYVVNIHTRIFDRDSVNKIIKYGIGNLKEVLHNNFWENKNFKHSSLWHSNLPQIKLYDLYGKWGSRLRKNIFFLFTTIDFVIERLFSKPLYQKMVIEDFLKSDNKQYQQLKLRCFRIQLTIKYMFIFDIDNDLLQTTVSKIFGKGIEWSTDKIIIHQEFKRN